MWTKSVGFCATGFWFSVTKGEPQQQGTEEREESRSGLPWAGSVFGSVVLNQVILSPRECLAMSRDILWLSHLGVLLASHEKRPGMPPNIPQCTAQLPQHRLAGPKASSDKVEEPCLNRIELELPFPRFFTRSLVTC